MTGVSWLFFLIYFQEFSETRIFEPLQTSIAYLQFARDGLSRGPNYLGFMRTRLIFAQAG